MLNLFFPGDKRVGLALKSTGSSLMDQGLVPSTHMLGTSHPSLQFQGIWCPLLASSGTAQHGCTYMHAIKTLIHLRIDRIVCFYFAGRKLQGTCPSLVSPVAPVKLCCCLLITVFTAAVVALSVALSGKTLVLKIVRYSFHVYVVSSAY